MNSARVGLPAFLDLAILAVILALFAAATVGPRMGLPYVGDDYVFLDRTRESSFTALWSPSTSDALGWYRPWSREVHFWVSQKLFGLNPTAFRCVNLAAWVVALCLYAVIVSRLASRKVAAIAVLGVAPLALWGTPLLWISGSQDLWMLVFALLSLWLFIVGHPSWALPPFVLALLSKETGGVLPALLCAYLVIVRHRTVREALLRTWAFWAVLLTWMILHPTLRMRLLGVLPGTPEPEGVAWPLLLLRSLAACFNLHRVPRPQELDGGTIGTVLLSALVVGGATLFATRRRFPVETPSPEHKSLARFAGAWALIGWAPLVLPSIGWHAYYGCVGALGAWFGLALWLQSRPTLAVAAIASVALLRGAHANTVSTDWGDEGYIQAAGSTLAAIRDDLLRQHPTLPPHSRVYFAHIPYRIGLVAGDSPALRVWYADSTLRAGYYSQYRPRARDAAPGKDYFFRFDQAAGMVEVTAGTEDVRSAVESNPRWEEDHDGLVAVFLDQGDIERAATEFEKISLLHHRADAALAAGVCRRLTGDSARADSLLSAARVRLGASDVQMPRLVERVERSIVIRVPRTE